MLDSSTNGLMQEIESIRRKGLRSLVGLDVKALLFQRCGPYRFFILRVREATAVFCTMGQSTAWSNQADG